MSDARPTFEVYDAVTGEVIESGYPSRRAAANAIAWAWNTGGETGTWRVRRDPAYEAPPEVLAQIAHARAARGATRA